MLFLISLLESVGEQEVANEIIARGSDGLMGTLAVLLIVNIAIIIIKYCFDKGLSKKENVNYRKRLICSKAIEKEAQLYNMLSHLSDYQKGENHQLLDEIIIIERYIVDNKILMSKKLLSISNKILDYYKEVISNFSKKDLQKEDELINKYCKSYYGD